jgi:hypothetical protein
MDRVKREFDQALVGLLQDAGIQKSFHIAMNRFYVPSEPARGLTNLHRTRAGHGLYQLPTLSCEDLEKKRWRLEAYEGPLRFSLKCLKEPPVSFLTRR